MNENLALRSNIADVHVEGLRLHAGSTSLYLPRMAKLTNVLLTLLLVSLVTLVVFT